MFAESTDIVGLAFVGTACTGVGCSVVEDLGPRAQGISAQTMAHESGHSLGANHDGVDNGCEAGQFIMSAVQVRKMRRVEMWLKWKLLMGFYGYFWLFWLLFFVFCFFFGCFLTIFDFF